MDHESIKLKIYEFIDGELTPEEAGQAAKHLETCADCREEADSWKSAKAVFQSGFAVTPASDFSDRVMMKIRERENAAAKGWPSYISELFALPYWELMAAAASFFIVFSYFFVDQVREIGGNGESSIDFVYRSQESSLAQMALGGIDNEEAEGVPYE